MPVVLIYTNIIIKRKEILLLDVGGEVMMQYALLYITLLAIIIPGAKIKREGIGELTFVQKNVNNLRGLFAIFIIYTHCTLAFSKLPILLVPLGKVSTFGVGFFFILSGYGLAFSYNNKNEYLNGLIYRKIPKILIAAILSRIITEIILFFTMGVEITIIGIFIEMNWYIYALIFMYFSFYFAYKIFMKRFTRVLAIWLIVIIATFAILFLCRRNIPLLGRSYYISEWAFPFGITIYEYKDEIEHALSKYSSFINGFMILLLGITFVIALSVKEYSVLDLVGHNLMLIPFYFFIFKICRYCLFDNYILHFLNKISFEIYLYQFAFLILLRAYLKPINIKYFLFTVILTVILAWGMNFINNRLIELLYKMRWNKT